MHTGYLHWMSYKQAQELFKKRHGKTNGHSPNRKGDYKYPCPKSERDNLTKVLKELKMI